MKLTPSSPRRTQRGNALILALVFSGIVALVVGSYLQLAHQRNRMRARSLAWNTALPVLEAGIEEALSHLKTDGASLTRNGWASGTVGGQPVVTKSRTFPDGSYFSVTAYTALPKSPIIYSSGFVPVPLGSGYISRTVKVVITNRTTFAKAISARNGITLSGGSIVDSFDSSSTNGSTGGLYDPAKRSANANVLTDSQAAGAISIGTGHLYGQANTGPGGTVTTSGGGTVGDLTWSANNTGIQPGYTADDANVAFTNAALPSSFSPITPSSGTVGGTNYNYVLGNGDYNLATLSISKGGVIVTGNARLYTQGDIKMTGSSFIYLAPGGSLQLYAGGSVVHITAVQNATGNAANFAYIGLPSNTMITYTGNSSFIGTVYAPNADFKISGGAALCGSVMVNSFTASGGSGVHFDQALGSTDYSALTSYTEL